MNHGVAAPTLTATRHAHEAPSTTTLTVNTGPLACEACVTCVEERLRQNPHVTGVHVDGQHQVVHVQVHEGMVTAQELAELVAEGCGERNSVPLPKPQVSAHAHAHTARPSDRDGTAAHAGHAGAA
jgi:hypothetical protein